MAPGLLPPLMQENANTDFSNKILGAENVGHLYHDPHKPQGCVCSVGSLCKRCSTT